MIRRWIRQASLWADSILIRTRPMGTVNQASCGLALARQLALDADKKETNSGKVLYNFLPPEMAPVLLRKEYDPYDWHLSEPGLRSWLYNHVVFDGQGYIIAIHDRGIILTVQEGWECEAEWYSRVKLAEDNWSTVDYG